MSYPNFQAAEKQARKFRILPKRLELKFRDIQWYCGKY